MITHEHMQAVRRLEIRARRRVDNLFGGSYHSAFKGRGIEFAEVREYEPGDDVRTIDWNVTARSGRPFVKRFSEERQLSVIIAIDSGFSSGFGSVLRTKHTMMLETAAVLALAAARNNDRVGVCISDQRSQERGKLVHIEPSQGRTHSMKIIRELVDSRPADMPLDLGAQLREIGRTHKKRCVVIVLSDFLSGLNNTPEPTWARPLRQLARKHELVALRCTDPREEELPSVGILGMTDPLTGRRTLVDTDSKRVRARYRERADSERGMIIRALEHARIDHTSISTASDYFDTLARFLTHGRHTR